MPVSVTSTAGSQGGVMQAGDTLAIAFSETVTTLASPVTVTESDNGAADTLTIPGVVAAPGSPNMGADYIGKKTASFSGIVTGTGTNTLTVTLSGNCSGTGGGCSNLASPGGTPAFTYTPDAGITDAATNAAVANTAKRSFNLLLF